MSSLSQPEAGEERLRQLLARPAYWTATAMQQQGSRFFQHLGAALLAADPHNRRRIYQTWPAECWDFHRRGLQLERAENEAEGAGARLPGMTTPEDSAPDSQRPDTRTPDSQMPNSQTPGTQTPDSQTPDPQVDENQIINTSGTPQPKPASSPDAPESVLVNTEKDPRTAGPVSPFGYREDYPPTLLAVFAHPDDEAFSVGGTLAHYARRGVRVVLACATRGEAGKITDPSMTVTDLGQQREEELKAACRALGIPEPLFLDYHDSGREERTRYDDPKALMNVPVFELEQKIRALIEEVQPQIIVTFDPHGGYGHIDHLQVNRATTAAFFSTGHLPKPPQRLYFTALTPQAAERIAAFNGLDPLLYGVAENTAVVRMNVWPYRELKKAALAAHGTQMGPTSRMGQLSEAERLQMENTLLGRESFSLGGTRASVPRWPLEGLFDGVNFVMYVDD